MCLAHYATMLSAFCQLAAGAAEGLALSLRRQQDVQHVCMPYLQFIPEYARVKVEVGDR